MWPSFVFSSIVLTHVFRYMIQLNNKILIHAYSFRKYDVIITWNVFIIYVKRFMYTMILERGLQQSWILQKIKCPWLRTLGRVIKKIYDDIEILTSKFSFWRMFIIIVPYNINAYIIEYLYIYECVLFFNKIVNRILHINTYIVQH